MNQTAPLHLQWTFVLNVVQMLDEEIELETEDDRKLLTKLRWDGMRLADALVGQDAFALVM